MMPSDAHLPKTAELADNLVHDLQSISLALEGEANRLNRNGAEKPNYLLLDLAGSEIIHATCVGVLEHILDVTAITPEAVALIDEYNSRLSAPRNGISSSNGPDPLHGGHGDRAATDSQDEETLLWRHRVASVQIEEVLLKIAREGDPAEDAAAERSRLKQLVLARTWEVLSDKHPASLSPEAARIKHELLPGVDPWLGLPRDFIKAAWVCKFVAELIEDRFDVITIAEAVRQSGIERTVIYRACQPTANRKPFIATSEKLDKELRLNRRDFWKWAAGHRARKSNTKRIKQTLVRRKYECQNCGWLSEKGLATPPLKCPKCLSSSNIRPAGKSVQISNKRRK